MTKQDLNVFERAQLPAEQDLPEMFESGGDLQSPSIYLMQGLSEAVTSGIAKPGDVLLALGNEDQTPDFLIGGDSGREYFDAAILRSQISYAIIDGGDFEWIDRDQFDMEVNVNKNRDAWRVYRYVVSIPEVDAVLPARLMLTKTGGTSVAKSINTLIARAQVNHELAQVRFSVATKVGRASGKQYYAFKVGATKLSAEDLAIARAQQAQVALAASRWTGENDAPTGAAVDQPEI